MKHYTVTDTRTNTVIATGTLGKDLQIVEGYYYFDRANINLDTLAKEVDAYTCPIKHSTCDYYYTTDSDGNAKGQEIGWIYEKINNSLFSSIEHQFGMYLKPAPGIKIEETES